MTITELITMLETLRKAEGEVDVRVIGLDRYGEMDGTYCAPYCTPPNMTLTAMCWTASKRPSGRFFM